MPEFLWRSNFLIEFVEHFDVKLKKLLQFFCSFSSLKMVIFANVYCIIVYWLTIVSIFRKISILPRQEEGFSQPYLESPKEENNNDTYDINGTTNQNDTKAKSDITKTNSKKDKKQKKLKQIRFNSSIKRNADSFVNPNVTKKIKTSNEFTSEDDSNSSTENLLPPSDMCRRRSWRRNSSHTADYLD